MSSFPSVPFNFSWEFFTFSLELYLALVGLLTPLLLVQKLTSTTRATKINPSTPIKKTPRKVSFFIQHIRCNCPINAGCPLVFAVAGELLQGLGDFFVSAPPCVFTRPASPTGRWVYFAKCESRQEPSALATRYHRWPNLHQWWCVRVMRRWNIP